MSDIKSYTFFPRSGLLYSGSSVDLDAIGLDGQYMASFVKGKPSGKDEFKASVIAGNSQKHFVLDKVRPDLFEAQVAKKALEEVSTQMKGAGQFDAALQERARQLYERYQAAVVNGVNTNQITIVQFVNEIVGRLEQPSFITTAFKNIGLDKLRGKIPEMGWPSVSIQVERLSEPTIYGTQFGQNEFRIYRNDVHIYTSREDRMEAVVDPHAVSISQGNIQVMRARELMALKELSNLIYKGNNTYGELPDFTETTAGNVPHATNDGPKAFVNVVQGHFDTWKNYIKYFVWNALDYRDYTSNWFTFAYSQQQAPAGWGVVPMKGMENYGSVAIISPYVPRGYVYALCSEGAYELDGPKITDAEYDAKKFADYNVFHDFIGYKIMHPARFGEKLKIGESPSGTEITTNEQIFNALKAPSDVVVQNASA